MAMSNKFLVFDWTIVDKNLIRWFPLLLGMVYTMIGVKNLELFIRRVFLTILTTLAMILIAVITGLYTWTSESGPSPLLPEYLKYQPFTFYWTVFILIGIIMPFFPMIKRWINYDRNNELIDR